MASKNKSDKKSTKSKNRAIPAKVAKKKIAPFFASKQGNITIGISHPTLGKVEITLTPEAASKLIISIAENSGKTEDEITTQQAAKILNVSRPFIIKQIERGALACRFIGTHRRLNRSEVEQYKAKMQGGQKKALKEMTQIGQELEMY